MKKLNRLYVIITIVGLIALPVVAWIILRWQNGLPWTSYYFPIRLFPLESQTNFLTDKLAIEKARETLILEGFDISSWRPNEDRRTIGPDGIVDLYLVRNTLDKNCGWIMFNNRRQGALPAQCIVNIKLKKECLECQVWFPK